ncbi:MAG: hypothetical protein NT068_03065 [Candidatus Nomurabacteria bacterium]|nr:hypothetical protein [Candidatus Nomurabacteria bacterium]
MKKKIVGLVSLSALAPLFAFAQVTNCGTGGNIEFILCKAGQLINSIIPVLISLGVVYFIWGVISYAIGKDEEAKKEGRGRIINGLIALLVIVSIWGLVGILQNATGVDQATSFQDVPCIAGPGSTC